MLPVIFSNGISVTRVSWLAEYAPGILLGFLIFGILVAVYLLIRFFKKSRFEREMMMRAEIAGEYEERRKAEQKEKRKRSRKKKNESLEYKPIVGVDNHLKEEEKQVVNILKEREGRAEQGTLRVVSGLPKSSLSRILKELEERKIVHKEKRGKKNMVFLK